MVKKNYSITIDGEAFDVSSNQALPLEGKTGGELVDIYNDIAAVAAGLEGFDPRKTEPVAKFKDKETGMKRIAALHSSVVAFVAGQAAEAGRGKAEKAEKTAKPKKEKINGARPVEPVAAAAASEASPATGKRGKPATFHLKLIKLAENTTRAKRPAAYRDGMTVEEWAREAVAATRATGRKTKAGVTHDEGALYALALGDVRYDAAKGVIDLRDPR